MEAAIDAESHAQSDEEPEDPDDPGYPDVPGYPDDPDDSEGSDPDYVVGLYPEPVAANGAIMANEENAANGAITANGAANEAVQVVAEVGAAKKRGCPPKNSKLIWGGNRRRLQ